MELKKNVQVNLQLLSNIAEYDHFFPQERTMNFQYLRGAKKNDSVPITISCNPAQAVAAGIFQLNTAVTAFRHLVDTVDPCNYNPQLRDKLDNMSQDIMLQVKETLDKLCDYFGWPYDKTTNFSLTKDEEVKGHKFAKDFQAVLEEFRKALNLAVGATVSQSQSQFETAAAGIEQINNSVIEYRTLVDTIGTSKDTPEHRKKLQEVKHNVMALMIDTSPKIKALGVLEQRSILVKASSTVKSKERVTKLKKVLKRWWKSDNLAPEEGKNSEASRLANEFQVAVQEFQKARLLASKRSANNKSSSMFVEGADHDITEAHPFLFEQKWQESVLPETEFSEGAFEEWIPRFKEVENQVDQVYVLVDTIIDLAYLAHEQAIDIDNVGARIEVSHATTSKSKPQQILTASSTSTRSYSSWCWLLVIFTIVVIGILLILIL